MNDKSALKYGLDSIRCDSDLEDVLGSLIPSSDKSVAEQVCKMCEKIDITSNSSLILKARSIYYDIGAKDGYVQSKALLLPCVNNGAVSECLSNMMIEQADYSQIASICSPFAQGGHPGFQYKLALCYKNGWGVDKNINESIYWLKKSVIRGKLFGHATLLIDLLLQRNLPGDEKFAFDLCLSRSRVVENSGILGRLARFYRRGTFVNKSLDLAIAYYEKARILNSDWTNELADSLMERRIGNDLERAYILSIKMALKGDIWCQLRLCIMFQFGIFVKKCMPQAYVWAQLASKSGVVDAISRKESLEKYSEIKHYDVGLVTFWFANNYGAILTAYALYKYVKSKGYSVVMIEKPAQWWPGFTENHDPLARRFASKYLDISLMYCNGNMSQLNQICDTFIVGSDQMWNSGLYESAGHYTFLDFVDSSKKKIAYATSFGHTQFFNNDPGEIKILSDLLHHFDAISTREETGVDLCKNLFNIDAICNVDSVFLCEPDEYHIIANANPAKNKPDHYIFAYILDGDKKIESILHSVSDCMNLPIILAIDGGDVVEHKVIDMDYVPVDIDEVGEWLDYIRSADFIITDSFHGTCFSIIFNKQFISIRNHGRGATRFDSILGKTGLKSRMIEKEETSKNEIESICLKKLDYSIIIPKLLNYIDLSKKWLDDKLMG